ncbi:hypothetical protein [Parasynechococcus sp.]|uniref:hypothetical protein n=1 Tax=Parasynechococcus sp. TaxID=3101203 RepID=UPI00370418F6
MSMFQRLLLIPCLAPLLALLTLSATNVGDKTWIRLLMWTTPALPVGAWTALAGVGGAAGAAAVAAFLVLPAERPLSRKRRSPVQPEFEETEYVAHESAPRSSANHCPERDVRETAPTVSVTYRVIQRPALDPHPLQASTVACPPQEFSDWGDDPDANW